MKLIKLSIIICLIIQIIKSDSVDIGEKRLQALQKRSLDSSNRIVNFTKSDFKY